ncbi:SusD/RagB family nutrient-binding outer membrane lipoprotein [Parafilimonas sp.]|uniref:SusD/RagB family nutrient-binding outer membrane lipoprotein n=1 Tax=Parafilimonas sp. TaxID=1969739 RepID=UPI0039E27E5C
MLRKSYPVLVLVLGLASCTKDFQSINVDPTKPSSVPLSYLLGQSMLFMASFDAAKINIGYGMMFSQQMATLEIKGTFDGDKYFYEPSISQVFFAAAYPNAIKNLVNLIELGKNDTTQVNTVAIARILKAFEFSMLTDYYGDLPYFEAGEAYYEGTFQPAYDSQQSIYTDLLKELDEAGDQLDASQSYPDADFVYKDGTTAAVSDLVAKWKVFANSLMLRLAMRLTKVDATSAQQWAAKAIGKGVMADNSQTFKFISAYTTTTTVNPNSMVMGPSDNEAIGNQMLKTARFAWGQTLIDLMKSRNDPRLPIIAARNDSASSIPNLVEGDHSVANARGLQNGLDATTLQAMTGETDASGFSRPRGVIIGSDDPNMLLTHAEVRFLKAEAMARGWVTGSAGDEYRAGQQAAIQQMQSYTPDNPASAADITAYMTQNPYPDGTLDENMAEIENEMYILTASTFNGYEAWANIRRTGLPVLVPVNYPGGQTGGTLPRRLIYPTSEAGLNPDGYQEAVSRMGGDLMTTRVWWDKQ